MVSYRLAKRSNLNFLYHRLLTYRKTDFYTLESAIYSTINIHPQHLFPKCRSHFLHSAE
ncbi:MAG: hypothetical protein LBC74_05580 [Planctomycetaceae bacterium]|nr:hypothetical protein [Planctomycetaceae bacterium]